MMLPRFMSVLPVTGIGRVKRQGVGKSSVSLRGSGHGRGHEFEQAAERGRRMETPEVRNGALDASDAQYQPAFRYSVTSCSMAPKMEWPALSFISIRIVSPKRMKGVLGSP